MPRAVSLIIRTLASLSSTPAAAVPTSALRDYFLAFDIDISFSHGPSLHPDPTDSPDSIRELLAEHAPPLEQGGPAVLVVADIGYRGSLVNGMLLDAERRGACAVFTEASGFVQGSADARFEVYAHEIGHLLNLTHEQANATFTSAMDSWGKRDDVDSRAAVWNEAIGGGPAQFAQRLRSFFGNGGRQPLGLPMSERCCNRLVGGQPVDVEPWRSGFVGADVEDAGGGVLRCVLEVRNKAVTVAQPLDITVTLSVPQAASAITVPPLLERTSGELVLQLQQPDGTLRILRPLQVSCTSALRRLRPRQKIRRHDSLISDCNDLVFPVPGRYMLRALVPKAGSGSAWEAIDVTPAAGPLAEPAMQEFLRRGMPSGTDAHWQQLDALVADKKLAPHLRADLSSRAAASGHRPFDPLRQLRSDASPAVAEQDALRRIAHLRRHAADPETLHQAIDHAERLFAAGDAEHPTLGYLTYVRRRLLALQRRRGTR